jgi:DNA-binding transcriptional ArsR family regulator
MKTEVESTLIKECPPKPDLAVRPLISIEQSFDLTAIFKVLANNTRLRILHALIRESELCVNKLSEAIDMKPQAVSNQLQKLVDRNVIQSKRNGNQIYYHVVNSCIYNLIDRGLCLMEKSSVNKNFT